MRWLHEVQSGAAIQACPVSFVVYLFDLGPQLAAQDLLRRMGWRALSAVFTLSKCEAGMSPHRAVLVDLVKSNGWTKGAELGVDKGVLFNMLLTGCPGLHLTGVDTGVVEKRVNHVKAIVEDFPDRAVFLKMTTAEAARVVPDKSFDFVFIDADHSEQSVIEDIKGWLPKVRNGGWLGGHDYNSNFPGVVNAVRKCFGIGKQVKVWPGSIWGVWT